MYYIFIEDWIQMFGRQRLHFLRLETYSKMKKNVTNAIFNFLEIGLFLMSFISSRRHRRWDGGSYGFYLRSVFYLFFCL